ncbi:hypothetical protein PInf_005051 [Phytophthora infestans]|nr:hypothetical protein PInf_005051 [Phytophthora infestans]
MIAFLNDGALALDPQLRTKKSSRTRTTDPAELTAKTHLGYESSSGESAAGGKRPVKRLHLSRSPPPKTKTSAKRSTSRSRSPRRSYKRKSRSRPRERSLTPERPPFPKRASGKRKASISYSERSRSPTPVKKKSRRTLSPKLSVTIGVSGEE